MTIVEYVRNALEQPFNEEHDDSSWIQKAVFAAYVYGLRDGRKLPADVPEDCGYDVEAIENAVCGDYGV